MQVRRRYWRQAVEAAKANGGRILERNRWAKKAAELFVADSGPCMLPSSAHERETAKRVQGEVQAQTGWATVR